MSVRREIALERLLKDLFEYTQLRGFIRHLEDGAQVLDDMPPRPESYSAAVVDAVTCLSQRNMIDRALFEELLRIRGGKREAIEAVARAWQVDLGASGRSGRIARGRQRLLPWLLLVLILAGLAVAPCLLSGGEPAALRLARDAEHDAASASAVMIPFGVETSPAPAATRHASPRAPGWCDPPFKARVLRHFPSRGLERAIVLDLLIDSSGRLHPRGPGDVELPPAVRGVIARVEMDPPPPTACKLRNTIVP